jgi:23S rRNA (uracil1939-C5)-methyltransferase
MSYGDQLAAKRERVRGVVHCFSELKSCAVAEPVPADPIVGYRSRAKLAVDGARVGLFTRGSHSVVDIPECRVLDPAILVVANALRAALPLEVPVRALDLQRAPGGVLATLVVPDGTDEPAVRRAAAVVQQSTPGLAGVAASRRDERSHQVLGGAPSSLIGAGRAEDRVLQDGPWHYLAPGGFAQAHRGQQRALLEAVLAAVERRRGGIRGAAVLELYAGAGALALALAQRGARVVAAESFEPSARLAREAAAAQGIDLAVEAVDAADIVRARALSGTRFDVVIVNPPRRGLAPSIRADIARLRPALVVYISCEPATLARDLADLARRGYAAASLAPYDMMPLTEEIETLAALEPASVPEPEVLHVDEWLIAVVKPPHEPTIPQGEHVGSLLDRVRQLDGGSDAVPVHRLDLGTSGVCLFARRPEYVPALARALTSGEKEYVALVRGIVRDKGSVRRPLWEHGRTQNARTRYTRRDVVGGHSLVLVRPDEGRKHQIRRHLASIGHPIVGDERYGEGRTNHHFEMRHFLDRAFLHCAKIRLPLEAGELQLSAPLAPDLALVLESLRAVSSPERE